MVHPASRSVGTGVHSQGQSGCSVKLTAYHHLASKLGMSGAIRLLPLYAFTAWTGKTLPLLYESEATNPRPCAVESVTVGRTFT